MKDTKLDDNASIYQKRENNSEKQKWSQLNGKQKFQYFKDYYLVKVLASIFIITFLISLGITVLSPREEIILNIAFFNAPIDEDVKMKIRNDLLLLLKPKKNQSIAIDSSFFYNLEQTDQSTVATEQKFSSYVYAEQIDIVIAEREVFNIYMERGIFTDLSDALPTNLYSRLTNDIVFGATEKADEDTPYGISLKFYSALNDYLDCYKDPVIGIVANAPNKHNSVKVIRLLTKST